MIGSLITAYEKFQNEDQKTTKSLESTEQVRAWKMTLKALQQVTYTYHHQQGGITLTMQPLILIVQLVMRYDMNHSSLWLTHGMVSHYWNPHTTITDSPFVRGVFIAHPEDANTLLGVLKALYITSGGPKLKPITPNLATTAGVTKRSIRNKVNELHVMRHHKKMIMISQELQA